MRSCDDRPTEESENFFNTTEVILNKFNVTLTETVQVQCNPLGKDVWNMSMTVTRVNNINLSIKAGMN